MAHCDGNCATCSGCAGCGGCGSLTLTEAEIQVLLTLAQIPFLPVARKASDPEPVYLEDERFEREMATRILQCLEKKQLISLDYDAPLAGCDYSAYGQWPLHGSMALTARGQTVVELLEKQGIDQ